MPTIEDLQEELSALRRLIALGRRNGSTPSEILKLTRECHRLWAAIEDRRAGAMSAGPRAASVAS